MVTACEIRRRFRACGRPRVALCQYCGRSFCGEHGTRLADGQEICTRPTCERKRADVERHLVYKEVAARRNSERLCGDVACGRQPQGQCSKCGCFFCLRHVEERVLEERQGATVVRRRASLCGHCIRRRSLWSKF